ncbi:MAG: signal peptide peptidase SppA [Myxococcota bacterium]
MVRRIAHTLPALLVAAVASSAQAGALDAAPRSVRLPWTFAPEVEGFEGTLVHGAGLGFLDGAELGLGWTSRVDGSGPADGFVVGGAGRLGPLGLGLAVSRVGEGGLDDAVTRVDLAPALRLGDLLAVGMRWHTLRGGGEGLDGFGSISLSATLRPSRGLSLALGVDRVNRPHLDEEVLAPILRGGLGIRPGDERVTFGAEGAAVLSEEEGWLAGLSLRFMPVPGLEVGGYGRFVRDVGRPDRMEWGAYLGLGQGGAHLGASLDRRSRASDDPVPTTMDLSLLLKVGTRTRPSLVTPGGKVVRMELSGDIPERPSPGLFGGGGVPLAAWLGALQAMARDDDVAGVLLDVRAAPDWGQCWELRQAMGALKRAGKRVYVRLTMGDMRAMYLASAADRVLLHSSGALDLRGLSITRTYLAGLLSKVGVNAQIVRWSEYKSAPEQFTRRGPSDPAAEQTRDLLRAVDTAWFAAVTGGRGLKRERLKEILRDGPQTMRMAHDLGLVDRVLPDRKIEEAIREDLGRRARVVDGYHPPPGAWRRWGGPARVAIVPVVGSIVDGEGSDLDLPILGTTTGDRDVTSAMDRALRDPRIVAIVIRVDSPGGSVTASERMYQAVQRAAERKPVVVSFGDVAASGGYYLAAGAPRILSTPLTITGSIGIFAGKVDLSGLHDLLGVDTWTERTAPHADAMGTHRPWTGEERRNARERLEAYYERFVSLVASGRGLDSEAAHERARGRVWIGSRALALNLVDAEGGLWDAVRRARREAGLDVDDPVDVAYMTERGLLARIGDLVAQGFGGSASPRTPEGRGPGRRLGAWLETLEHLGRGGLQTRMPYLLEIR